MCFAGLQHKRLFLVIFSSRVSNDIVNIEFLIKLRKITAVVRKSDDYFEEFIPEACPLHKTGDSKVNSSLSSNDIQVHSQKKRLQ